MKRTKYLTEFCKFKKYEKNSMMVVVDVGLDENSCYANPIKCAIDLFLNSDSFYNCTPYFSSESSNELLYNNLL